MLRFATKFAPERAAFQVAASAGFRFAELWLDARCLADWRAVAELAREYPLQYALHFPVSEVNPEFQNPLELQMDMLLFRRWWECEGGHRGECVQPRRAAV
jgi:hypothetical protein